MKMKHFPSWDLRLFKRLSGVNTAYGGIKFFGNPNGFKILRIEDSSQQAARNLPP